MIHTQRPPPPEIDCRHKSTETDIMTTPVYFNIFNNFSSNKFKKKIEMKNQKIIYFFKLFFYFILLI